MYQLLDINYFHCTQIVEILKETEADTKSIFGRYGSQRMKDWQEGIVAKGRFVATLATFLFPIAITCSLAT